MNSTVAVVICNWNKKNDVLACIDSVLQNRLNGIDIFVVDNASTDGSVDAIKNQFGDKVFLIENRENLGGSGGFNKGIQEALKEKYRYIHLLDNDVILDSEALKNVVEFLEQNPDVGAVGSKLYVYDNPEQIQELGADIDWEKFSINPHYKGHIDNKNIPKVIDCDYVPACSVMIRTDVIRKIGLMDESCFIYWDDIDWFYRMKIAGYRVVAYSKSKVWHKMGAGMVKNTFPTYYFWRNKINFFAEYVNEERLEEYATQLHDELFRAIYLSQYKGQLSSAKTLLFALDDALHFVRGRAIENRIFERESIENPFEQLINGRLELALFDHNNMDTLRRIINFIHITNPKIKIILLSYCHSKEYLHSQFPSLNIELLNNYRRSERTIFQIVDSILTHKNPVFEEVDYLVDPYLNVISSKEQQSFKENYYSALQVSKKINLPYIKIQLLDLKVKKKESEREKEYL